MSEPLTVAKAPCKSCPYRKDVPSGLWAKEEYNKLPIYDRSIGDQIMSGAGGVFLCHQQDGKMCAGWVGCHGNNAAALRIASRIPDAGEKIDPSVFAYKSPVPLFASGQEACDHGKQDIKRPKAKARRAIEILEKKAKRRVDKLPR